MPSETYSITITNSTSTVETTVEARSYKEAVALLMVELIQQDEDPDDNGRYDLSGFIY